MQFSLAALIAILILPTIPREHVVCEGTSKSMNVCFDSVVQPRGNGAYCNLGSEHNDNCGCPGNLGNRKFLAPYKPESHHTFAVRHHSNNIGYQKALQ